MKNLLLAAGLVATMSLMPAAARAQGAPSAVSAAASTGTRLGLSAPVHAAPFPLAAELMQEGGHRHSPGVSLIIVGAIGMLAGLLFNNGNVLWIGSVVTAVGLVIYLF